MEDVRKIGDRAPNKNPMGDQPSSQKKKLKVAASIEAGSQPSEAASISVTSKKTNDRNQIHKVLEEINLAIRNTDEITTLLDGISGIASQASKADSVERLGKLQLEAQELAREIAKIADTPVPRSSSTDPKINDFEEKLHESLSNLKKPSAQIESGLNSAKGSKFEEDLLNKTKKEIESLTSNIRTTALEIKKAIDLGEIAVENNEASFVMVRDVEQAAEMAKKASLSIGKNPNLALGAIGVSKRAQDLIK
jgi:hypothetical protein